MYSVFEFGVSNVKVDFFWDVDSGYWIWFVEGGYGF